MTTRSERVLNSALLGGLVGALTGGLIGGMLWSLRVQGRAQQDIKVRDIGLGAITLGTIAGAITGARSVPRHAI